MERGGEWPFRAWFVGWYCRMCRRAVRGRLRLPEALRAQRGWDGTFIRNGIAMERNASAEGNRPYCALLVECAFA